MIPEINIKYNKPKHTKNKFIKLLQFFTEKNK